jgi:hypothetical protein
MAIQDSEFKESGGENCIKNENQSQRNKRPEQTIFTNAFY